MHVTCSPEGVLASCATRAQRLIRLASRRIGSGTRCKRLVAEES